MTQHTPFPLEVEHPFGEPGVFISGPNTELVAKLYGENAEANALLFVGVQDLLEALDHINQIASFRPRADDSIARIRDIARAAITKARGGAT